MNNLKKLGKIEEELDEDLDLDKDSNNDVILSQLEDLSGIEDLDVVLEDLERMYKDKSNIKEKYCGLCYGILRGSGNVSEDFGKVCNRCNLELLGLSSGVITEEEGDICKYCGGVGDIGIMSWNGLDLVEGGEKICNECLRDNEVNLTGSGDKCMSCNRKGFVDSRYLEFGGMRGVNGIMCDKCLGKKGIKLGNKKEELLRQGSYPSEEYIKGIIEDLLGSGRYGYLGKVKGIDNISLLNGLEDMSVYFQLVLGGKDYYEMIGGDRGRLGEFGKEVGIELEKKFVGFRFRVKVGIVPE